MSQTLCSLAQSIDSVHERQYILRLTYTATLSAFSAAWNVESPGILLKLRSNTVSLDFRLEACRSGFSEVYMESPGSAVFWACVSHSDPTIQSLTYIGAPEMLKTTRRKFLKNSLVAGTAFAV